VRQFSLLISIKTIVYIVMPYTINLLYVLAFCPLLGITKFAFVLSTSAVLPYIDLCYFFFLFFVGGDDFLAPVYCIYFGSRSPEDHLKYFSIVCNE
jgi:hypothetical protein